MFLFSGDYGYSSLHLQPLQGLKRQAAVTETFFCEAFFKKATRRRPTDQLRVFLINCLNTFLKV